MSRDLFVCLLVSCGKKLWRLQHSMTYSIALSPPPTKNVYTQCVSANLKLQIKWSCRDCLNYFLHCHNLRESGLVYFMFYTLCVGVGVCVFVCTFGGCAWEWRDICAHDSCGGEKATSGVSQSSPFTLFESVPEVSRLRTFREPCLFLTSHRNSARLPCASSLSFMWVIGTQSWVLHLRDKHFH